MMKKLFYILFLIATLPAFSQTPASRILKGYGIIGDANNRLAVDSTFIPGGGTSWDLSGNAGTNPITDFIGTTDAQDLSFRVSGVQRMRLKVGGYLNLEQGYDSTTYDPAGGANYTLLTNNLLIGDSAGWLIPTFTTAVHDSMTGHNNTIIGDRAGKKCIKPFSNTFIGAAAGMNTIGQWGNVGHNPDTPFGFGYENVFVGTGAGEFNTTGYENTFVGTSAGQDNTTGITNTAVGQFALGNNTTANENNGFGRNALANTTTGVQNVAMGNNTAFGNVTGTHLNAIGYFALGTCGTAPSYCNAFGGYSLNNTTGTGNIGIGFASGSQNTSGANNIFIGMYAGSNCQTLSNKLIIDHLFGGRASVNHDTTRASVYISGLGGDSSTQTIKFDAVLGINNGSQALGRPLVCYNATTGYTKFSDTIDTANPIRLQTTSGRKVGIGNTAPTGALGIENSGIIELSFDGAGGNANIWNVANTDLYINTSNNVGEIYFGTDIGEQDMTISAGQVGIQQPSPSATLDLVGTFQYTDGNQASGKVLTSDGSGNATWQTGLTGTATNDAAAAGVVGQEINSTISTYANYSTTATYQNVTSIALTAGDWDISAFFTYSSNGATLTAASNSIFVISTTTASAAGATEGLNIAYIPQAALLGTSLFSEAISSYRVSLSGSTTYYLNTQATFTLGNPQYVGSIRARRMR